MLVKVAMQYILYGLPCTEFGALLGKWSHIYWTYPEPASRSGWHVTSEYSKYCTRGFQHISQIITEICWAMLPLINMFVHPYTYSWKCGMWREKIICTWFMILLTMISNIRVIKTDNIDYIRFDVLLTLIMQNTFFWNVKSCGLVEAYWYLTETCCLHLH
jgi:hypothetical protein